MLGQSLEGSRLKFIALTLVALGLAFPAASHADVGNRSALDIEFDELSSAIARGDCSEGLALAHRITARGAFKGFPAEARGAIWTFVALCAEKKGLDAEAFEAARNATEVKGAGGDVWTLRLRAAGKAGRFDDAPAAIAGLARADPKVLNQIPIAAFDGFKSDAVAAGRGDAALTVFQALEAAQYRPEGAGWNATDLIWLDEAVLAADAGDTGRASALVTRLTLPYALLHARLDTRFAPQVAADPARFDLAAAAERQLAHDRAEMSAHPDHLAAVRTVAGDLIGQARFDAALALIQAGQDQRGGFTDQDALRPSLLAAKAQALEGLGRFDEAVAVLQGRARLPAGGPGAQLDLAELLDRLGRADAAVATLKPLERLLAADPAGLAEVRADRACVLLARRDQAVPDLAWLTAHARENPAARLRALVCAGAPDDLAAAFIAQLKDPDQREAALVRLSTFDPPAAATPIQAARLATMAAIRARRDVQAAIAATGHTEHIPLCACVYGDGF